MDKTYQKIIIIVISGTMTCLILGTLFLGPYVFNVRSPFFQVFTGSIIDSVSFALFQTKRYRDSIFVNILLFVIFYFITGRSFFLTYLLCFAGVVFSVYLYSKCIFNKLKSKIYARPLILAGIYAIVFILVYLILSMLFYSDSIKIMPLKNMPIGFLIGLGLGIGFEIAELIKFKR